MFDELTDGKVAGDLNETFEADRERKICVE